MANAWNKPSDPGVRRGVSGSVVSLDLSRHRCIIFLEDRFGDDLGSGILDTEKLEARLEGVSGLDIFIGRESSDKDRTPDILVIEDVESCKREVARLQRRGGEGRQLILAIDCEGVNLGKEGPLTLLQIGTEEGEVFVFDVLATPDPKDMFIHGGLKALLENPNIRKVIHDCRSDQCALYFQFGVTLTNVFDTSAAYTTIWDQCNIFSGPFRPKLASLIEIFRLTANQKTEAFAELVHDKQLFGQRPLTEEMIEYASDDVFCLLPVIYESLDKLISPLWRPHFEQKVEQYLEESRIRDPNAMYEENQG
ncbi:putative exosome component 10-like [Apostichopus japonicus]|uniref:Putative exosome component 10-like n=1 Tax=Stichopus japonicus TaxID=307972 RepID=A0A2G8L644_STIJA|nr:putative exosome component 10-like [Apostichopus japonicus]